MVRVLAILLIGLGALADGRPGLISCMRRALPVLVFLLAACTHIGMRVVPADDIEDPKLSQRLAAQDILVSAVWRVPRAPDLTLAIITRPGETRESYGPQLAALRDGAVVHESPRLFDDDFIYPSFVEIEGRTLMLADHGSEDAYGVLVWSFEGGRIRDLGELPIAFEGVPFTSGAASSIGVKIVDGRYVLRIRGPLLLYPLEKREEVLRGWITYEERDGKLVLRR